MNMWARCVDIAGQLLFCQHLISPVSYTLISFFFSHTNAASTQLLHHIPLSGFSPLLS